MKLTRVIGRVCLGLASVALAVCCAYLLGGYECNAEAHSVDAPIAHLFAFEWQWRRATDARR